VLFTIAADEASRESLGVEVGNAGFVVPKVLLKVWQILGYKTALTTFRQR